MSFLDTSLVTSATASRGATVAASSQQSLTTPLVIPPTAVISSTNSVITGVTTPTSVTTATTTGTTTPAVAQTTSATALAAQTTSYLQAAISSLTSTFSGNDKALASTINSSLSKIFNNTNVPAASTTTTQISDPVDTLFKSLTGATSANPTSGTFSIGGFQAGSQAVTMSGSNSSFGSGSSAMTGSVLSTVINRLSLDATSDVGSAVSSAAAANQISGLFSTLTPSTATPVITVANGVTVGGVSTATPTTSLASNDLQSFLTTASPISESLGVSSSSLSSYYLTNPTATLVDQSGTTVSTNQSGVDATTANAILSIMNLAGCASNTSQYTSANSNSSLFNLALTFAAVNGMASEVNALLGCSTATGILGQQAITNAFVASAGTQIGIASTILPSVSSPTTLNTPYVTQNILTNPTLTASDAPTVESILNTMGTSTTTAMTVPSLSTEQYPVYDTSILSAAQPSFVDGVFGDSTMTDYLSGYDLSVQSDGSFGTGITYTSQKEIEGRA